MKGLFQCPPRARSFWAFSPTLLPLSGLMTHLFSFFPLLSIFLQKSQGLLKLKLYAKLFRLNAIRLISFEKENG